MSTYRLLADLQGPEGKPGQPGRAGDRGLTGTFASVSAVAVPADAPAEAIASGPQDARHLTLKTPRGLPAADAIPQMEAVATWLAAPDSGPRAALDRAYGAVASMSEHSAVGDGVADDTAALLATIADARGRGLTAVTVPKGIFAVDAFHLPDGLSLQGPGTLRWRTQSPAGVPFITLRGGGILGGASLRGVTIDGNRAANPRTGHATRDALVVVHADSSGSSVVDCKLLNSPASNIVGQLGASRVRVANNLLRNAYSYNVSGDGHDWIVLGNNVIGGTNGVRFGKWSSDLTLDPSFGYLYGNIASSNTFFGLRGPVFHAEIHSYGAVFRGNTARMCTGITKIQYQPGEEVFNTVFDGNTFLQCGYQVAYDDATMTATQRTDLAMITPVAFGGYNTLVTGNIIDDVAGVTIAHTTQLLGNLLLNIGSDNSGVAGIRADATSAGAIIAHNRLTLHPGRQTLHAVRIDAPNVRFSTNEVVGKSGLQYLVSVYGAGCQVVHNLFRDSAGAILVPSTVADVLIDDNDFVGVTAPLASVTRTAPRLRLGRNRGAGTAINVAATTTVVSGAIDASNARRLLVGTGTDGVSANLTTINGGQPGDSIVLERSSASQVVTVAAGGNIRLKSGSFVLGAGNLLYLAWVGTEWIELQRF